jgi:hypothetical protein
MADELTPAPPDGPPDPRFDDLPADRELDDEQAELEVRDGDAGELSTGESVEEEEPDEAPEDED